MHNRQERPSFTGAIRKIILTTSFAFQIGLANVQMRVFRPPGASVHVGSPMGSKPNSLPSSRISWKNDGQGKCLKTVANNDGSLLSDGLSAQANIWRTESELICGDGKKK